MNHGELVLALQDQAELFNAPPIDPFSSSPTRLLGISGFDYLLKLLVMEPRKSSARTLRILLPPDKANARADQTTQALHRLAEFRMEEERRELRHTYRDGWRGFGIALVLLAVCIALSSFFASEMTENLRPHLRKTLEYSFEIIGWVMLWHPIEVLVFSPRAYRFKIQALRTLASIDLVIGSQ